MTTTNKDVLEQVKAARLVLIKQLLVKSHETYSSERRGKYWVYKANENLNLKLEFVDEKEAATFLVEAIRYWNNEMKTDLFCIQSTWGGIMQHLTKEEVRPESQWYFTYKDRETSCGGCCKAKKIMDLIFYNNNFYGLPFLEKGKDSEVCIDFDELKYFAENGREKSKLRIDKREQEKNIKEKETKRSAKYRKTKKLNEKLDTKLNGMKISNKLRKQILPFANEESLKIINGEVAVVNTMESIFAAKTYQQRQGVGAIDHIVVFYHDQNETKRFKWRDDHHAEADQPKCRVHDFGKIRVYNRKNVTVHVELLNPHGDWTEKFTFSK